MTIRFEQLASGLVTAEGPVALSDRSLLCVEVLAGNLTSVAPDGKTRVVARLGGGPNGAALGPDGRCYVCNNGGLSPDDLARLAEGVDPKEAPLPQGSIQAVDLATGQWETAHFACGGTRLISPNDLAFDREGGYFFTDYGAVRLTTPQSGAIYHAGAGGSLRKMAGVFERPNGIGISPDQTTLYVSETSTGRLWSAAIHPGAAGPVLSEHRLVFEDMRLRMDSLVVQADGRVCVACPHNDVIARISPGGSAELIATPPGGPSNICFGGSDNLTAFVTMLRSGSVLTAKWDAPGLPLPWSR